jgi:hypothetical protein
VEVAVGTMGDGPTAAAGDNVVVPLVVCRSGGTLVEHPITTSRKS